MSLQVLIKSPNQAVGDLEIACDPLWTVGQLKDYLHSTYPTRPVQSQQRIIYCGRVLSDHLVLDEVFTNKFDKHTMHLVCPHSTLLNYNDSASSNVDQQPKPPQPSTENVLPTAGYDDRLRHRFLNVQNNQLPISPVYPHGALPQVGAVASPYMAYQLAAMQQTYAQFLAQAFAQNQALERSQLGLSPAAGAVPEQDGVAPGQQPNVNPVVPNAPLNVAEPRENDLLDFLYIVTRIFFLFMVLYFYSTPGKVFLVITLGVLFCMYKAIVSRIDTPPVDVPNDTDVRVGNEANRNAPTRNAEDNSNDRQGEDIQAVQDQDPAEGGRPRQQAGFSLFTFIKTFFTSLVPENPLPIQT